MPSFKCLLFPCLLALGLAAAETLRFEAEHWARCESGWTTNTPNGKGWRLWTKDSNAMAKWSGGRVLVSPPVMADRKSPEEGAPALKLRLGALPSGTYEMRIRMQRALALSLDLGKTWQRMSVSNNRVAYRAEGGGKPEIWVDDLYAEPMNPGVSYLDALELRPIDPATKAAVEANPVVLKALDFISQTNGKVVRRTDKVGVEGACFSHWDNRGHGLAYGFDCKKEGRMLVGLRYTAENGAARGVRMGGVHVSAIFPATPGMGNAAGDWKVFFVRGADGLPAAFPVVRGANRLELVNELGGSLNLDQVLLYPEFLAGDALGLENQGPLEADQENPRTWIDPFTGHRVVNLSKRPGGSSVFYFHQDPFLDAKNMLFKSTSPGGSVLFKAELPEGAPVQVTESNTYYYEVLAKRRGEIFYFSRLAPGQGAIYGMSLATGKHRLVTDRLPMDDLFGVNLTVNADETLLATAYAERMGDHFSKYTRRERWPAFARLGLTNHLLTIHVDSGEVRDIYKTNAWLGHVQFAPCDPNLLEFCREISADSDPVKDRCWVIRADGSGLKRVYPEDPAIDSVTHEFWDPKRPIVWFDLRTPTRRSNVYLAGVDVATGKVERLQIPPESWSIHYNSSVDNALFCGDGAGWMVPPMDGVPDEDQGKWIWLFRRTGNGLAAERLFDMRAHDYVRTEPNVHFDPSGQWVLFTYNGEGGRNQVFSVEVKQTGKAEASLPRPIAFDAEDIAEPRSAWQTNKADASHWRLWTDDPDGERWFHRTVLVSPPLPSNRAKTDDGAPMLHLRATKVPPGTWEVSLKCSRALGVSLDGGIQWQKITESANRLGTFTVKNGVFEVWVDDRYALPENPGPAYLDCLVFRRKD